MRGFVMQGIPVHSKRRLLFALIMITIGVIFLIFRVGYLQIFEGSFLQNKAYELHNRERNIAPARGIIYDRNGTPLALSISVAKISVIHNQIEDSEEVARILSEKLELDYETVKKKVDRVVALETIQTHVDKDIADEIRKMNLKGVVIDQDFMRFYPYKNLASHVLGFVGKDNQGIIGLEVKYDQYLKGKSGKILTQTDAKGINLENTAELRIEPEPGEHLVTSIDLIIQQYAEQALEKVLRAKNAKKGSLIVMNPQNGEIYAMTNKPDFDLNEPFTINDESVKAIWDTLSTEDQYKYLNHMWRNFSINDTYEPGSTFKMITASAGLQEEVVHLDDTFFCPGYKIVADRRIRCHKAGGHGSETFLEGVQNSCNPVFMEVGERLGPELFYKYLKLFEFDQKTGIDVPGEAVGIMHNLKDVGPVELATMSFGQSFQITPMQLLRAASSIINGGELVTPHFGMEIIDNEENVIKTFQYKRGARSISKETSDTMRMILESVVSEGTGSRMYIPGYKIGGKTATSEKLPRSSNKYISSFVGFAPADHPKVLAIILIDEPEGIYYGGTVAAPVIKELYENILPYLGFDPVYTERDLKEHDVGEVMIPNLCNIKINEAKKIIQGMDLNLELLGEGDIVVEQFPLSGENVNKNTKLILYLDSSEKEEQKSGGA